MTLLQQADAAAAAAEDYGSEQSFEKLQELVKAAGQLQAAVKGEIFEFGASF